MTAEDALKRGAEAGWALGLTLKEVCPEQSEIAIKAAIIALNVLAKGQKPDGQAFFEFNDGSGGYSPLYEEKRHAHKPA
jgi:hypothetical protein